MERYNRLDTYLKNKFGEKVLKICIDGGFSCPNRDGKLSIGGCIFCSEKGSGEHINSTNIKKQVENFFNSYKADRANKFIVYFQNFTNTYDSIENLKKKYDSALIDDRIVGLSVATRPDCIDENIVKLLSSYTDKYYVSVELGLQTSNDNTAEFINRGYETIQFTKAVELLNKYNIDVVCHIIVGLPYETTSDLVNTIKFVNKHSIKGIKIHSCYVIKNTKLALLYTNKEYSPITLDSYLNSLIYIITHLRPDIVIHRISGDAPKELLIAPDWSAHKKWILNKIPKILKEKNLYQGIYYKE